ncbi:MAG TPA: prolyl oligopeptidase family serine peptidase [Gemmata sp.]|jgi:dipeptidyl aminopeptidase/acylaminoacyl peptidase|nr:prolyl oligopeptidase family serine peptidase [Gemmata sp.]
MFRMFVCGVIAVTLPADLIAQGYQRPPKAVTDILDVPPTPAVSISPTGDYLLLIQLSRYPSIEEVAAPQLRLAGLRIDPKTNGPARSGRVTGLTLVSLPGGEQKKLSVPPDARFGFPLWAHDGKRFAFTNTKQDKIEVWVGEVATGDLWPVSAIALQDGINATIGDPVQWMPDSKRLLCQVVTDPGGKDRRGQPPVLPLAPVGPVVQEGEGKAAPVRMFQDMLKDPHDEALFDYHASSRLVVATVENKPEAGKPVASLELPLRGVFYDVTPSPDGKLLLVTRIKKPYSYLYPYSSFPRIVEVYRFNGELLATIADQPLQDKVPIEGVPVGPRSIKWIPMMPGTLVWVEALDEGDPRKKVPHRDAVFSSTVGSTREPLVILKLEHRFTGLDFFQTDNRMLIRDYDRERKWARTFLASTTVLLGGEAKLVFERSSQDRYGDPGTPLTRSLPSGHRILRNAGDPAGDTIWLSGPGASPQGDRPFLDRFNVKTGQTERVFHCAEGVYEDVVAVLNATGSKLLVRRESETEPANYFYRDPNHQKQLTHNTDPAPELRKAKKQLVTTKRSDGTTISFTLYMPPNHKEGEKVPAVFYAYPVEFASADTAGQVIGSPHRFTAVGGYSHLFFLTQGYAVMEVSMPVVGPPATANDTFVEQLVSNAKAALDKAGELGVDTGRVGVMGHSYGAFMTANLLAHSDLFRAGIARSGAYNRTLTPFGFQNERRTFWESPDVYGKMSPFYHANKIGQPLLLIHGAADNNPGTFTVQSERMYQAVRGNGGTVRLVLLPHESHGYEARESIEHVLFEQFAWFDKYVKK